MNLPNSHFTGYPIEFKEINPEDFPNFNTSEKINLTLTNSGYIGDSFIDNISLAEKNTVVLNCGVGSGKTTAIIRAIKQFHEGDDYVIFVASPFVSLVEQYFLDIQEKAEIPQNQIYRNEWIGETSISYIDKRVHVVTINTLLGNPGENSPINSNSKRRYLNEMVRYCEDNNKKIVFIYDEIHDSIHNFKEKYIFNLWKWRNVIHKNFVISATYSEASKVVIEYLAELTENKIKILEAERVRNSEKLSDLYLHFDNAKSYTNENGNLISIVESVFQKDMDVDILCFSKKLCKDIIGNKEVGAGKLLFDKYGENINDCTSGLQDNERQDRNVHQNRYGKDKCNIGTNFKSGVSIEKNDHAFILILPPVSARGDFKSSFGIFTGGINNVIQALARKRKKGEIHILLPRPTKFNFDSFAFNIEQKRGFKKYFEAVQFQSTRLSSNGIRDVKTIDYIPLNQQERLLYDFYKYELLDNVEDCISHIESIGGRRGDKVRLQFPEYKLFKLEQGEDYIAGKYKFLGKDLSGYICYSAATNQFVNCNWVYSNWKPIQNFKEGKLQYCFDVFFENYFREDWLDSLKNNVSDKYIYFEIRNEIFKNHNIKLHYERGGFAFLGTTINKLFETQLIAFIQRKLYRNNREFIELFEQSNGWAIDNSYSRAVHFRSCISHSVELDSNPNLELEDETKVLVEAYLTLNHFRLKLIQSIQVTTVGGNEVRFITNSFDEDFIRESELEKFESMISVLSENDYFIKNEIFDFKTNLARYRGDIESKKGSFYTYLKNDFLKTRSRRINNSQINTNVKEILEISNIPDANKVLNFVESSKLLIPEENIPILDVSEFQNIIHTDVINIEPACMINEVKSEDEMRSFTDGIPEESIPTLDLDTINNLKKEIDENRCVDSSSIKDNDECPPEDSIPLISLDDLKILQNAINNSDTSESSNDTEGDSKITPSQE